MTENKIVACFYLFCLVVAVLFAGYYGINAYTFCHLIVVGMMPLCGLFLLHYRNNAHYFFLGVSVYYLLFQLWFGLKIMYGDFLWYWRVCHKDYMAETCDLCKQALLNIYLGL